MNAQPHPAPHASTEASLRKPGDSFWLAAYLTALLVFDWRHVS